MQSRLSSADPKADGAKLTFLARKTELQVEKSWLVINCVQRLDLLIGQPACQVLYIHSDLPIEFSDPGGLRWQRNLWTCMCFTKGTLEGLCQFNGFLGCHAML